VRIKVRKADIPTSERDLFERYGENVIGLVLGGGFNPAAPDLHPVYADHPTKIHARDWLTERGDLRERHESLTFWLEVGVLVFVILGVVIDALILRRGL
jgi:hypothetical protein